MRILADEESWNVMKNIINVISIFFFISIASQLYSLCIPAYPFEFAYVVYQGEKKGDVANLLHVNAGVRLEAFKEAYFDLFFLGDLLLHVNKEQGLYADMAQKDVVDFLNASLNFPSILGKRISLALFFGKYDDLGSDSILREHIKASASASVFMKNYPANIFRPNLDIRGAGIALYGALPNGFYTGFYTHWNTKIDDSLMYTNDFRFGFAYSTFAFETFLGFMAKKNADDFRVRLGAMGSVNIEDYELFFEMGFARLAIHNLSWNEINSQFYVLFEPRVKKEKYNIAVSFFMSSPFQLPKDMDDKELRKTNFLGFNILVGFGNLEINRMMGGLSLLTAVNILNVTEVTPFTFSIAPFLTVAAGQVEFDFRLPFNPLLYKDLRRAIMGQVSVKAVY